MSALLHFSPSLNGLRTICIDLEQMKSTGELNDWIRDQLCMKTDFRLVYAGRLAREDDELQVDGIYHFTTSLYGGKGGFGSMLRAIGAQIEKTTNREACRDLQGRRMRDVNNEKKLKDWISKKADREQEKDRVRRERLARRLAVPKHKFDDPNYETQKTQAAESLEHALQAGLKKSKATSTVTSETHRKRPVPEEADAGPSQAKSSRKSLEWMGVEGLGGSDMDSDLSGSDEESVDTDEKLKCSENQSKESSDSNNSSDSVNKDTKEINAPESGKGSPSKKSSLLTMLPPPTYETAIVSEQSEVNTPAIDPASVNLDDYSTAQELEKIGLNVLKSVLTLRGLKCGGTLQERAKRLFSVKGLNQDEIPSSLLAKPLNGKTKKKK